MNKNRKCWALTPLSFAVALGLASVPCIATAQPDDAPVASKQAFDVKSAQLNTMLLSIARQGGRVISFDPTLASGYTGHPVKGTMTIEQAIASALQGTELVLDITSNGTLTVDSAPKPVTVAATNITSDAQLPEISVTGAALNEDQLYYNPSNASGATRTDTPIKETAQSIEVISTKLLNDRQATDVADALKSSAGVQQTLNARGADSFTIRGFSVQQTSTNGVSNPGLNSTPIQGVERVEVIKGPDSIMSGSSTPGGTINIVRKAPVTEDLRTLTLEMAENGEFKQGVDLGGALNEASTLSYRLNLSNMKSDSADPDFDGNREVYVAPALTWNNEQTKLTVGGEYSNNRSAAPRSTVAIAGQILRLPKERLFRRDDGFRTESKTGYYEFTHEVVEGLSFNSKATYLDNTDNLRLWQTGEVNPDGSIAFMSPFSARINTKSWSMQNDIRAAFETGFIKHKVLVGIDYQHILSAQDERSVEGEAGAYPSVNIYDSDTYQQLDKVGNPTYRANESRLQQRGLILQNQMDLGERTHVLIAAKKAKWISDSDAFFPDGELVNGSHVESEKWVPNYGISFDVTSEVTVYANLLHGFTGSASLNEITGEPLAPLTSKSKEVGVKVSLFDDSITLTSAYFEMQQNNIPVQDPITQDVIGAQSQFSKGYDLNLSGEILPGWNMSASYTHVEFDEPALSDGGVSVFTGEPENSFSLWTSYELQEGKYKGFGAGVGLDAFSDTKGGTAADEFKVPGGASTDVSVFYHGDDYSVTLGVKNVFDRTLYFSSSSPNFIPMQPERNARLTFVYNF